MDRSALRRGTLVGLLLSMLPVAAWAQDAATAAAPAAEAWKPDTGDTTWLLVSSALVLLMTPGLALFYGGMARRKNVLGTFMQSFIAMGIISVLWAVIGYTLAFGKGGDFVGGMEFLFMKGVGIDTPAPLAGTVPHQLFMAFQLMFAIITPALISGAFAERMKFKAYLVFIALWSLVVYSPLAHWVWSPDGWLFKLGALDFAGGTVVHISSGITALVACVMIGKRKNYPNEEMRPHNLTMTLLGTGLLWFGWYGFNGGSAVAAGGLAVAAFVNTHMAAAAAMMAWVLVEWAHRGKPTALGAASGAVAGLVGITPGAGFVEVMPSLAIGAITSVICYFAVVSLKPKLGYDDSLDTFGVHGIGGTVGAILTGVFCTTSVNAAGKQGLLYGNPSQVVTQLIGVAATWAFAALVGGILLFIVDKTIGLRVKSTDEEAGLDVSEHGEEGYVM
ncbi:MAG: amt2 [Arthrobacter sp.]|jgi:Amt family ammonium transporter|nr:amt2 [Arthrobacter sp.]